MIVFTKKTRPSTNFTKKERQDTFLMTWDDSDPRTWDDCDFSWDGWITKIRQIITYIKKPRI